MITVSANETRRDICNVLPIGLTPIPRGWDGNRPLNNMRIYQERAAYDFSMASLYRPSVVDLSSTKTEDLLNAHKVKDAYFVLVTL